MRQSRRPGPPSTLSGSSASGSRLVHGSRRSRSSPAVFLPGEHEKKSSKKRTKVILILGIALPVLACIIGITAWAVTTDVLRVNPRSHDTTFSNFGHRGKTRGKKVESRNDEGIDVFVLHGLSQENDSSTVSFNEKKTAVTNKAPTPPMSKPALETLGVQKTSQTASDIISKLISDMPIPKNPKNFVVFAPVADTTNEKSVPQGRKLDGKVHILQAEDLVAQESIASEDISQERIQAKVPFNTLQKSSKETLSPQKLIVRMPKNYQHGIESSKKLEISRNERITPQPIINKHPPKGINGYQDFLNPNIQQNLQFQHINGPNNPQSSSKLPFPMHREKMAFPSINVPNSGNNQQFSKLPSHSFQQIAPSPSLPAAQSASQINLQTGTTLQNTQLLTPTVQQRPSSFQSPNQRTPRYQNKHFEHHEPLQQVQSQQPIQGSPLSLSTTLKQNQPTYKSNSHTSESTNLPGSPQYFAPQTFHTKTSYESSNKLGSLSSYERVAQSATSEATKDGQHHHHHHHHHHEPTPLGSDPIGDVNLSDVPNRNDADRLGNIGLGLGSPPRGITVQIGGGGLGGSNLGGGLLPLSALGIARNVMNVLMPRPRLGLNSKVFVGFELGRGRRLLLG